MRSTAVVGTLVLVVAPDGDDRGGCVQSFGAASPDKDHRDSSEVIVRRRSSYSSSRSRL